MTIDTLLDWQERGMNARILGLPTSDHPLLKPESHPGITGEEPEIWQIKYEAWLFGWLIEDSVRQFDTGINGLLIRPAG